MHSRIQSAITTEFFHNLLPLHNITLTFLSQNAITQNLTTYPTLVNRMPHQQQMANTPFLVVNLLTVERETLVFLQCEDLVCFYLGMPQLVPTLMS